MVRNNLLARWRAERTEQKLRAQPAQEPTKKLLESRLPAHIYRRVWIDHDHMMFCDTHVPTDAEDLKPIVGDDKVLDMLVQDLRQMGYQQTQRRAFEAIRQ